MHDTPPRPQAFLVVPAAQLPWLVQQPMQVTLSHTQEPFTQCLPLVHALPEPHTQRPAAHPSAKSGSQVVQAPPPVPQLSRSDV
jgi:hypothetical protein